MVLQNGLFWQIITFWLSPQKHRFFLDIL